MGEFNDFRTKTLREIRLWAWAAAVLPITALAGIFFVWVFGSHDLFDRAMVLGETTMFGVAVVWWWWAIYVIRELVRQWETTRSNVSSVLDEVRTVKDIVKGKMAPDTDK